MRVWFDGHLDLAYIADHGRDLTAAPEACGGTLLPAGITFSSLRAGEVTRAVGTIFVRRRRGAGGGAGDDGPWSFADEEEAYAAGMRQVEMYRAWEREGRMAIGGDGAERLGVMLGLEGCACVRRVEDLRMYVEAGVRMVALAWAEGTQWAGGDQSGGGVTAAGRELVAEADRLGCVQDVSHLSERAFWELLECAEGARGGVVASHSNCRKLVPWAKWPERHLSDEQIGALARRGGVIGVNLYARFLVEDAEKQRARVRDVVKHIEHIAGIGGRGCVALGSDADSGFTSWMMPAELERPDGWWELAEALSERGWSDGEVAGFMRGNWERVLG